MKKILLLFALLLCVATFGQKKKTIKKGATTVLAQANNVSAELTTAKDRFMVMFNDKGKKDTLFTKKIDLSQNNNTAAAKNNNIPFNCAITPFMIKSTPLYVISWSENNINEAKEKTEDRTQVFTEIWNSVTKTQVMANVQTTTKIKEILWLDKLKNASQTSEKLRKEGFEFSLTKEGDVLLKNKTQENRMVFNPGTNLYEDVKSAPSKSKKK